MNVDETVYWLEGQIHIKSIVLLKSLTRKSKYKVFYLNFPLYLCVFLCGCSCLSCHQVKYQDLNS